MSIKLFASDLDGTLLQNGAKFPPNEVYDLVLKLKEKGIIFVAASGRQYHSIRKVFGPVADEIAYVCENGSLVIYEGKILYDCPMDRDLTDEINNLVEQHSEYYAVPSSSRCSYVCDKYHDLATMMREGFNYYIEEVPNIASIDEPIIKFSIYRADGMTDTDELLLKERFGNRATVTPSGITWIDLMHPTVDKKVGLSHLADALGISMTDCMAVGDHYNDYGMLESVGHPVAVLNAQPGILELCKQKTDTVASLMSSLL
ncbi:Hydrolase (HAD superfamily) [Lachnospiraceae bacterium TWA4]|nr:Hydrolase (HAD superfamily) [Lachnospiraceae bacterium TWA4]